MTEQFPLQASLNSVQAVSSRNHAVSNFERLTAPEMLIELAPDAIFVTNSQGTLEEVNVCACEMLGYSREEFLGKTIATFISSEDQARLAVAQTAREQNYLETWTYLHKDGNPIQAEVNAKRLPDGRWVAFVRSLRERQSAPPVPQLLDHNHNQLAEPSFQRTQAQVRRILDSLFSFVGVTTPDGILIEANRAALDAARLQAADVLGKPFPEAYWWSFSAESRNQLQAAIRRAASGESVRYTRVRLSDDRFGAIRPPSQRVNDDRNDLESAPSSSEVANLSGSLANIRLVIVDDEPDNLELLRFLLSAEGVIVSAFASSFAALQSLTQVLPDLLISDIGMPEIDGYEFIRQVRSLPSQQNLAGASRLKAIALTAFAQEVDQRRAIGAGYQVCLAKPIDPAEVIATVKTLLF